MVRPFLLALGVLAALAPAAGGAAEDGGGLVALSPTAFVDADGDTALSYFDRPEFQMQPGPAQAQANHKGEDFAVVSIISLPFTALYSFLGAALIQSAAQKKFPPEMDAAGLAGAAGVALGSSLLIATFSVDWGAGAPAAAAAAASDPDSF